jgi:hypothetical protein
MFLLSPNPTPRDKYTMQFPIEIKIKTERYQLFCIKFRSYIYNVSPHTVGWGLSLNRGSVLRRKSFTFKVEHL